MNTIALIQKNEWINVMFLLLLYKTVYLIYSNYTEEV